MPPLPLLFLLVVEGLSRNLKELAEKCDIMGFKMAVDVTITHLLFVDDILIFGSGSLQEWHFIKEALDLFCEASGMSISHQKSLFSESGLTLNEISDIKHLFPIEFSPLELASYIWDFI